MDEAGNAATSTPKRFLVVRPVHSRVWANFSGVGRRIALTFDDCYVGSAWGSILDTLKRYGVEGDLLLPRPGRARESLAGAPNGSRRAT